MRDLVFQLRVHQVKVQGLNLLSGILPRLHCAPETKPSPSAVLSVTPPVLQFPPFLSEQEAALQE